AGALPADLLQQLAHAVQAVARALHQRLPPRLLGLQPLDLARAQFGQAAQAGDGVLQVHARISSSPAIASSMEEASSLPWRSQATRRGLSRSEEHTSEL